MYVYKSLIVLGIVSCPTVNYCLLTGKTFVYFVTKIRIVFEPAIFSVNIFLKSIFFLINQIAKRGQKLPFPKQTPKNDRNKRTFFLSFYTFSNLT